MNTHNELYAYGYDLKPEEEPGSGDDEIAVGAEAVFPVEPMMRCAMEQPISRMRIDGQGSDDRSMMWRIPDVIKDRKLDDRCHLWV